METTLRQAGLLLLDSIPTIVMLLLLYALYQNVVRKPLERILAERRERIEGAMLKARADVSAAEVRTQEYEQKLREARLAIFKAQEARRQHARQLRMQALEEARQRAQAEIQAARAAVEADVAQARARLETEADRLASEIIRIILKPAEAVSGIGGPA
jgi:F-type H+-transporting ATPase subunit b